MSKTPAQHKRGKGGRFVAGGEPASEVQSVEDPLEEGGCIGKGHIFHKVTVT